MFKYLIVFIFVFTAFKINADELFGIVIKVYDGDTITLVDNKNKKYKIRLDKIDAPEKKQLYGLQSQSELAKLILNKKIKVIYSKIDRYQRVLGVIYLDNIEVNLYMVKNGFAWHYGKYDKTLIYIQAQKDAQKYKKGLWQYSNSINPERYRKLSRGRGKIF